MKSKLLFVVLGCIGLWSCSNESNSPKKLHTKAFVPVKEVNEAKVLPEKKPTVLAVTSEKPKKSTTTRFIVPPITIEPDPIPQPDPYPGPYGVSEPPLMIEEPYPETLDDVLTITEELPEFPGGMAAMRSFLAQEIHYPDMDKEAGIEGKAYVKFVVQKDGTIRDVRCVKSPSPSIGKEAERAVKAMPNWIPGKNKNQPVNCYMVIPVLFNLD